MRHRVSKNFPSRFYVGRTFSSDWDGMSNIAFIDAKILNFGLACPTWTSQPKIKNCGANECYITHTTPIRREISPNTDTLNYFWHCFLPFPPSGKLGLSLSLSVKTTNALELLLMVEKTLLKELDSKKVFFSYKDNT